MLDSWCYGTHKLLSAYLFLWTVVALTDNGAPVCMWDYTVYRQKKLEFINDRMKTLGKNIFWVFLFFKKLHLVVFSYIGKEIRIYKSLEGRGSIGGTHPSSSYSLWSGEKATRLPPSHTGWFFLHWYPPKSSMFYVLCWGFGLIHFHLWSEKRATRLPPS